MCDSSSESETDSDPLDDETESGEHDESRLPITRRLILRTAPAVGFGGFVLNGMSDPAAETDSTPGHGTDGVSTSPTG